MLYDEVSFDEGLEAVEKTALEEAEKKGYNYVEYTSYTELADMRVRRVDEENNMVEDCYLQFWT